MRILDTLKEMILTFRNMNQSPGTIKSIVKFATHSNVFQPVVGGYYLNDSIANPDLGYWWSSTASSGNGRLHLGYISSSTTTYISDGVRYDGRAIRCVR